MIKPPKLVIFDCDGVLVDSEPIFNRVLHDYLTSQGANLSFQDCVREFTGKNRYAVEKHMQSLNTPLPADWSDTFYTRAIDTLSRDVTAVEGIHNVVKQIADQNIPMCVASNGLHAKMVATLTKTKLLPYFENKFYSSYDISGHGKPAPDIFLHAAAQHGTATADCIVIEDTASGFEAAQAAGIPCFAYQPDPLEKGPLFGATPFHSMADLPDLIGLSAL